MDEIKKQQQAQLLALYRMVIADGTVDPREITQLYQLGIDQFGLSEEEVRESLVTENYAVYVPDSTIDKAVSLYQMATIAAADGVIDESEKQLLIHYIKAFKFVENNADQIADILLQYALDGMTIEEFKSTIS